MKTMLVHRTSRSALVLGAMAAAWCSPALAAEQTAESETDGGEIVVTAEKREESRKDVPTSIEVISGETLVESGVQSGFDIVKYLPGFGMDASAEIRTTTLKTRGIGTLTNSIGLQSSNLLAVDDEVLSRQSALNGAIIDLERVEALRGPQGTLFGENTSTGLIHYITKRPKIGENSATVELGLAQYGEMSARGMANIALGDSLAVRLNGSWSDAGAYIKNVGYPGNDIGDTETWGVRGQLLYDPGNGFHALVRAEYSKIDTNCCAFTYLTQPVSNRYPALVITNGVATISSLNALAPQPWDPTTPVVAIPDNQYGRVKNVGISGEIGADVTDNITFTYAGSYRNFELANNADTFNSVFPISRLNFDNIETTRSVQQEVRLSSYGNDKFNWVVGLFYHDTKGDAVSRNDRCTTGAGSTGQPRVVNGEITGCFTAASSTAFFNNYRNTGVLNNALLVPDRRLDRSVFGTYFENMAVFGQATYNLTERFDVTVGGRFLRENSSADFSLATYRPLPTGNGLDTLDEVIARVAAGNTSLLRATGGVIPSASLSDSVNRFIYKGVLGYDVTDDIRVYASYATGFKGVSYFITSNTNPADGNNLITRPERSRNIELGLRSTLFDRKLALNVTLFDMSVKDYQLRATRVVDALTNTYYVGYVNAELARSRGVEVDFTLRPVRNLSIYGSFAYFDANFDKFANAPITCPGGTLASRCYTAGSLNLFDQSGLPFPNNSEKQLYISANYDVPVGSNGWEASLRGDFRWQSERTPTVTQIALQLPSTPATGIFDLYLGLGNDRVKAQLFVKNLFNKFYVTEEQVSTLGEVQGFAPRDYKRYIGGSLTFSF